MSFLSNLPPLFLAVLAFILALGPIIFIHEAGHLLMARAFNIRVLAFSLGFGKRLWGFQRGETDYRLSIFPLGGYVKLGGETHEEASSDPRDFVNRPRWQRILVYLAGPAMNAVLSVLVVAGLFMVGVDLPMRNAPPVVGFVVPESPAAAAGIQAGDRILSVGGAAIKTFNDVDAIVATSGGKTLAFEVERAGQKQIADVTPILVSDYQVGEAGLVGPTRISVRGVVGGMPAAAAGFQVDDEILSAADRTVHSTVEFIGIISQNPSKEVAVRVRRQGEVVSLIVVPAGEMGAAKVGLDLMESASFFQKYGPIRAVRESVLYNADVVRQTFFVLGRIFRGQVKAKDSLSGPVQLAKMSGDVIKRGPKWFLNFIAFISISIGLLNLFPIPILDGGQILILLIESVWRRDLPMVAKERLAQVGLVLILALMAFVFYVDIAKMVR